MKNRKCWIGLVCILMLTAFPLNVMADSTDAAETTIVPDVTDTDTSSIYKEPQAGEEMSDPDTQQEAKEEMPDPYIQPEAEEELPDPDIQSEASAILENSYGFADVLDDPQILRVGESISGEIRNTTDVLTYMIISDETVVYDIILECNEAMGSYAVNTCLFTDEELLDNQYMESSSTLDTVLVKGEKYYFQVELSSLGEPGSFTLSLKKSDKEIRTTDVISLGDTYLLQDEFYYGNTDEGYYNSRINPNLPQGISYDEDTNTLTLTDVEMDLSDTTEANCYLRFESLMEIDPTIVVKGNNVFKGLKGREKTLQEGGWYSAYETFGINAEKLNIIGDGTLTLDLSQDTQGGYGIMVYNRLNIDGPTVNIMGYNGDVVKRFYGINMGTAEYGEDFGLFINNAKVNITNSVPYESEMVNIGIDSQAKDISIANSEVNVTLSGGKTWGILCGHYNSLYSEVHGGKLSIDKQSHVTVKMTDTSHKTLEKDMLYALYFYKNNVNSNYVYVAEAGEPVKSVGKTAFFTVDEDFYDRYESKYSFVEFSPVAVNYDGPAVPHRHYLVKTNAKKATCTKAGNSAYWTCSVCKLNYSDENGNKKIDKDSWIIPAKGHSYQNIIIPATESANGKITPTCSVCSNTKDATIIYKAKNISLSRNSFTYTGKPQRPKVTVKDSKNKDIDPAFYTLSWSNKSSKEVGTYKATVTFKGNYSGKKIFRYKITPAKNTITNVKTSSSKTLSYKKAAQKVITLSPKAKGGAKITYKITSMKKGSKKIRSGFTVSKGTVKTVQKLAKGTYTVQVKISAAATKNYNAKSKTVTLTVKIK